MNTELLEALDILEKEKNISKDVMLEAIENSLLSACKNHFGTSDNIKIVMDRNTCDYSVYAEREVVEEVFDPAIDTDIAGAQPRPARRRRGLRLRVAHHRRSRFGQDARAHLAHRLYDPKRNQTQKYFGNDIYE